MATQKSKVSDSVQSKTLRDPDLWMIDMDYRDVGEGVVQRNTRKKYTYMDVLRTGPPPDGEKWATLNKKFNVLNIPQPRKELERMPRFW